MARHVKEKSSAFFFYPPTVCYMKSPVSEKDTFYLAAKSESNVKSRPQTPNWPLSFVPVKAACIIKLPIVIFLFSNCAQNYISFLKIMLPLFFNSRLQAINECVKMYDVSLTFSMFWYNLTIFILQHYTCFFLSYLLVARRYFVSYASAN